MAEFTDDVKELLADVRKPTEERAPQNSAVIDADKVQAEEKSSDHTAEKSDIGHEEPEVAELSAEAIEASADIAIGLFDFSQVSVFRWLVRRKKDKKVLRVYGEDALEKMERLINERDAGDESDKHIVTMRTFTSDEVGLLRMARKAEEIIDDLPLDDREKDLLKIPLMQLMKERGGHIPPSVGLMLAITQITGARLGELFMM